MKEKSATPRRRGALCGVVAVAAMTLVTALLRAVAEVPTPAELIGDRLGERVPVKPSSTSATARSRAVTRVMAATATTPHNAPTPRGVALFTFVN